MDNKTQATVIKKQFCRCCGSHLKDEELDSFNEYTGEKNHELVCQKVGCERSCDFYGHEWKRIAWWDSDVKCVKCGYFQFDW